MLALSTVYLATDIYLESVFFRSSFASLISVCIVSIVWAALRTNEFLSLIRNDEAWLYALGIVLVSLFLNVVPDYISLLESRVVIGLMKTNSLPVRTSLLLFFDFIATSVIATAAWFLFNGLTGQKFSTILEWYTEFIILLSVEVEGETPLEI